MNNDKIDFKDDKLLVFICAFRYSLGRMTYVPGAIVDLIHHNWEFFDEGTKKLFAKEIMEHKELYGKIGMNFDEAYWMTIVERYSKEPPKNE